MRNDSSRVPLPTPGSNWPFSIVQKTPKAGSVAA